MPEPGKVSELKGRGAPLGSVLVIDPGSTCGIAHVSGSGAYWNVFSTPLADLPKALSVRLPSPVSFVVCEDFHLIGGRMAQVQAGSDMPSAQGIGMCRVACEWSNTPLYLAPPNVKRAGRAALSAFGRDARAACRNEHQRDVVDLAGYVFRQLGLPA